MTIKEALGIIQKNIGLHQSVEIIYAVDGYEVQFIEERRGVIFEFSAENVEDALVLLGQKLKDCG